MKPKTFCQMMKAEWIPSKDTWVAQTLINKMRATWTSGKYPTDGRQKEFMKLFVAQVAILPQGVEMPARAFLTAYDMVVEQLTGVKMETPKFVSSMTGEDAASSFEGEHTVGIVTQTITKVFKPVALPEHLKKCEVKDLPKPEARSHREILLEKAIESVKKLTEDTWDMQDSLNLESICENLEEEFQLTSPEELPERVVVDEKDIYLDEGVCKAIRQACMQLMAENLKGGNEFYKGKYGSYTVYEPEFWLAKAHQQLHGYCFENYVEEKDTGDLTVEIVRESYRTTPAGDTARAFLGTLGLVSEEVALDWEICINTPNADEEDCEPGQLTVGDCFEFGLVL